ncbi:MAG: hypothetical protein JW759_10475 [Candidatus Coatesbacteria bacterium]|nr:hypothetical protein [Candidatus Coatesbacteria bacterium]
MIFAIATSCLALVTGIRMSRTSRRDGNRLTGLVLAQRKRQTAIIYLLSCVGMAAFAGSLATHLHAHSVWQAIPTVVIAGLVICMLVIFVKVLRARRQR